MIETFAENPARRWRFFSDTVMGGVSSGRLQFDSDDDRRWARMTGTVSTANNGGFIQMQTRFEAPLQAGLNGVRLVARGNDERYFIHLRRAGAAMPTAFYRAGFEVTSGWRETRLPFGLFTAANQRIPATVAGTDIASLAVVAFGKDHDADICVSEIGFY